MEAYRYQQLVYLVVPVMLGMEFFMTAKNEKKGKDEVPFGTYVLDFFGFIFATLIPSVFIFTIWAIEGEKFIFGKDTLARFDRYAVLFFFLGAWWQVYMIAALRARRLRGLSFSDWYIWLPYVSLGIYISLLILWVSPWSLKWISVFWFLITFIALKALKVSYVWIERVFWILALLTFFGENLMFLWLDAVV